MLHVVIPLIFVTLAAPHVPTYTLLFIYPFPTIIHGAINRIQHILGIALAGFKYMLTIVIARIRIGFCPVVLVSLVAVQI